MAQCLVIPMYIHNHQIGLVQNEQGLWGLPMLPLPPMSLPQAMLPDGARFAGAGQMGEDDVYLFVLNLPFDGKSVEISAVRGNPALDARVALLASVAQEHDVPQDFVLRCNRGNWRMTACRDLEERLL